MTSSELFRTIRSKRSFLCVGLDTDSQRLPTCMAGRKDAVVAFNRAIIDATAPYAVAYKPNLAFYEAAGTEGLDAFWATCRYLHETYPDVLVIADAKRGDVGHTAECYARAFFGREGVDAVTLSPYMGRDAVEPFLRYPGKWAVVLALTSNPSASNFEIQPLASGRKLFEEVLRTAREWGSPEQLMFVVGATQALQLDAIREIVPDHFLLVPGVGAQGGSLHDVAAYGMNARCGLLVNASRSILYASSGEDFAAAAAAEAHRLQQQMEGLLGTYLRDANQLAKRM